MQLLVADHFRPTAGEGGFLPVMQCSTGIVDIYDPLECNSSRHGRVDARKMAAHL
jgi:hypothetical protein